MVFFQTLFSRLLLGTTITVLLACALAAHPTHPAYLQLTVGEDALEGQWSIPLVELWGAENLPSNLAHDLARARNWSDLEAMERPLSQSLFARLRISREDAPLDLERGPMLFEERSGETFLVFPFAAAAEPDGAPLALDYALFAFLGTDHRCLLDVESAGGSFQRVLQPGEASLSLQPSAGARGIGLLHLLGEGIWHILIGYDHILFLLVLVLPLVARADSASVLTKRAIKVVSAFALAHSVTLALAALGWVRPPMAVVEIVIALTVASAAVVSFFPRGREHGVGIALVFGLVHGFGFANVLSGLDLAGAALIPALLAFNVGVELGQLLIIGALLPVALSLRHTRFYELVVVRAGSLAIISISVVWIVVRVQSALGEPGL